MARRQAAADPQTRPKDPGCESACRLPETIPTIAIYYYGKSTPTEHPQIASKVTEIGRISVVMYVSDHFCSSETAIDSPTGSEYKVGALDGDKVRTTKNDLKTLKTQWRPLANEKRTKGSVN